MSEELAKAIDRLAQAVLGRAMSDFESVQLSKKHGSMLTARNLSDQKLTLFNILCNLHHQGTPIELKGAKLIGKNICGLDVQSVRETWSAYRATLKDREAKEDE